MSSPRVSILIPVYNRKKYIAECIQSALDQTFTDHEIVVVDNASDDGTWEICQQFSALDSRVRVFRNAENIGPVRNWMRCAQQARGEYSKILFSDDLLEPDCIARMLQPFEIPGMGFVFCASQIGESKEKSTIAYWARNDTVISSKKYLSLLLNDSAPRSPGAVLLRTKDLIKNLYFDFPTATPQRFDHHGAGPDLMIMILTLENYSKLTWISTPLVFFRAHEDSFSISNSNNEVIMSYTSIIAYHLHKKSSNFRWLYYLAWTWLTIVRNHKLWINPIVFLRTNEGKGSITEILISMLFMPALFMKIVINRISR